MADGYDYIATLSLDQLRQELRRSFDESIALNQALLDLPAVPDAPALRAIQHAAMNTRLPKHMDLWQRGKTLQKEHGGIPFKTEYECAAGLWSILRDAVLAAKQETT